MKKHGEKDQIVYSSTSLSDRESKTKMLFVGLIMISVSVTAFYLSIKGNSLFVPVIILILGLYLIILLIGLFNKPISYNLSNSVFYIKRQAGLVRIKLSDIKSIREFTEEDKKGLYRKFGAEGLFSNFGIYSSKLHRTFTVYSSRDSNWVLIETRFGKKIVISPDDLRIVDKTRELIIKNYGA